MKNQALKPCAARSDKLFMLNEMYNIRHIAEECIHLMNQSIKIALTLRESLEITFGIALRGHREREKFQ